MVFLTSLIVFVSEKVGCAIVLGALMYFVYLQAKHNPSYSAPSFGITRRIICKCWQHINSYCFYYHRGHWGPKEILAPRLVHQFIYHMLLSKKDMMRRFFSKKVHEQLAKTILNSTGHKSWTSLEGKKWSQEFKLIYFSPACWEILECFLAWFIVEKTTGFVQVTENLGRYEI